MSNIKTFTVTAPGSECLITRTSVYPAIIITVSVYNGKHTTQKSSQTLNITLRHALPNFYIGSMDDRGARI